MKTKIKILTITLLISLMLSACNASPAAPTMDPAAASTIEALNLQVTQIASTLNAIIAEKSATPAPTNTPDVTSTLTLTPAPSETPTPLSGVWLLFDSDTNCRFGPGTNYGIAAKVDAGTKLQAIAQNTAGDFYYVRFFDTSNHYCWVTTSTSYRTGNPNILPVYTAQPSLTPSITPTSGAGFTVAYNSLQSCSATYSLLLTIKNTGFLTWQSIKVVIVDSTSGVTVTHTSNMFNGYNGCTIAQQQQDLSTNEPGQVSNYNPGEFTYDPTGHSLVVTVSLYSDDNQSGTTVSRVIQVKP